MSALRLLAPAFAAALVVCSLPVGAEVQKFLNPCGGQQLCASYQLVFTPPAGWVADKEATLKNKVQIIVPKGKNFATAPALIYVQVFYHADKQQSLADFARVSNDRWRAAASSAKISELAEVERASGKPGFLRFAFFNPAKAQQSYEVGSFGIDNDKDGNEFVLDVVMTGSDKAALDRADGDYVAFLKSL